MEQLIIVTGAAGGIGSAVCHAFANQGANLVCADINEEAQNETVAAITGASDNVVTARAERTTQRSAGAQQQGDEQ